MPTSPSLETILCAAIHIDDGREHERQPVDKGLVFCGHRHHNIIGLLCILYGQLWRRKHTQGFLTSTGRFVDRTEALQLARAAGQTTSAGPHGLFSEDLY